jgi:hypothetical protein
MSLHAACVNRAHRCQSSRENHPSISSDIPPSRVLFVEWQSHRSPGGGPPHGPVITGRNSQLHRVSVQVMQISMLMMLALDRQPSSELLRRRDDAVVFFEARQHVSEIRDSAVRCASAFSRVASCPQVSGRSGFRLPALTVKRFRRPGVRGNTNPPSSNGTFSIPTNPCRNAGQCRSAHPKRSPFSSITLRTGDKVSVNKKQQGRVPVWDLPHAVIILCGPCGAPQLLRGSVVATARGW